ncbi:MAG: hypothetical protein WAL38_12745, partial [Solirubrobacteraceae bacterium]
RSFNSPANALNFSPIAASSATRPWFYEREPQSCNVIYLRALSNGDYEVHNIGVNWPHHSFVNNDFEVIGAND